MAAFIQLKDRLSVAVVQSIVENMPFVVEDDISDVGLF